MAADPAAVNRKGEAAASEAGLLDEDVVERWGTSQFLNRGKWLEEGQYRHRSRGGGAGIASRMR